jgi:hypothetical protein
MRGKIFTFSVLAALLLSGCGNSVYGPRRLIWAGYADGGRPEVEGGSAKACPAQPQPAGVDLTDHFYTTACMSLRAPGDAAAARIMMEAGTTLSRMRCNDFFAERAGNQARQRIIRRAVLPVSALITGLIALRDFKTEDGRSEAVQLLGLGQTATIAGLELYEAEFLFGSANVNSVRLLTMRALDEHAARILESGAGFYAAARHLIDHQMVCTPANILALSQDAIRTGAISASEPVIPAAQPAALSDQKIISAMSSSLRVDALSADELGALWWLEQIRLSGAAADQDTLAVLQDRLKRLPLNPVQGAAGALTVDTEIVKLFSDQLKKLSGDVTNGFVVTRALIMQKLAAAAPPPAVERAKDVRFQLPAGSVPPTSRAIEVGVQERASSK